MNPTVEALDTENWMSKLPETQHKLPLYSIAIPGTHDSFSYSITSKSDVGPDIPSLAKFPLNVVPCIVKPITYRWCKSEVSDCTQQLLDGIRYFDLRIASKKVRSPDFRNPGGRLTRSYNIVHGLYGSQTEGILREIHDFLKSHPKEIVLLDFQWLYEMASTDHKELIDLIGRMFDDMLVPFSGDLSIVSLDWLWKKNHQLIVFYRDYHTYSAPYIWPRTYIPNPWANTTNPFRLFHFLSENYNKKRNPCFYVTQSILTPRWYTIASNITGTLESLAILANPRLLTWLQDKNAGLSGLNVVICDFYKVLSLNLPKHIIYVNYKRAKTPSATASMSSVNVHRLE